MAQSVVKQVKRSHTTEFKRKGNEKQYRFNDEVIEKLEATDAELEGTEKEDLMPVEGLPVNKARTRIKEDMQLFEERQK